MLKLLSYTENYSKIATLDPLGLDSFFQRLPELNTSGDVGEIIQVFDESINGLDFSWTTNSLIACQRDLGMLMSSIRFHSQETSCLSKEHQTILVKLGEATDLPPRESSFHYGLWNPQNQRIRTFTSWDDEVELSRSVFLATTLLSQALFYFLSVFPSKDKVVFDGVDSHGNLNSNHAYSFLEKGLKESLTSMANIRPHVFSQELRPFFDSIEIGGELYIGPGGGQIPLMLFDELLFGLSSFSTHYEKFVLEGIKFFPKPYREVFHSARNQKALLYRLDELPIQQQKFIGELAGQIVRFRQHHIHLAQKSFTPANIGKYNTGSAGYTVEVLHKILEATKQILKEVKYY